MRTVGLTFQPEEPDIVMEPETIDEPEIGPGGYNIEEMTVPQLKQLAADIGIDIGKGAKKDEIIAAIVAAGGEA